MMRPQGGRRIARKGDVIGCTKPWQTQQTLATMVTWCIMVSYGATTVMVASSHHFNSRSMIEFNGELLPVAPSRVSHARHRVSASSAFRKNRNAVTTSNVCWAAAFVMSTHRNVTLWGTDAASSIASDTSTPTTEPKNEAETLVMRPVPHAKSRLVRSGPPSGRRMLSSRGRSTARHNAAQ